MSPTRGFIYCSWPWPSQIRWLCLWQQWRSWLDALQVLWGSHQSLSGLALVAIDHLNRGCLKAHQIQPSNFIVKTAKSQREAVARFVIVHVTVTTIIIYHLPNSYQGYVSDATEKNKVRSCPQRVYHLLWWWVLQGVSSKVLTGAQVSLWTPKAVPIPLPHDLFYQQVGWGWVSLGERAVRTTDPYR